MRPSIALFGLACLLLAVGSEAKPNAFDGTTSITFEGVTLSCAPAAAGAGCNINGCWSNGGGCNSYGCWNSPDGSCNFNGCSDIGVCSSYGCPKGAPRPIVMCGTKMVLAENRFADTKASCNAYGCWEYGGGCNSYGCFRSGGGCNSFGCWNSPQGGCNTYGCSDVGVCNVYGCPTGQVVAWSKSVK